MTAYVPYHEKKAHILVKREQELLHAIKNNYSKEKLEKCVEKLGMAKLSLLKARFAQNNSLPPHSYFPDEQAKRWGTMSIGEILQKYL